MCTSKRTIPFLLIAIFACNQLCSQDQTSLRTDTDRYEEQFKIREGILSVHKQTVRFKKDGRTIGKIMLGEPVVVAMAEEPMKWGYFQFPSISRTEDGTLIISWQMKADSYKTYGKNGVGKNKMMSRDNGRTWADYDGSYDKERFKYTSTDGDEFMSIDTPSPYDLTKAVGLPKAKDEILHYGIRYLFYKDDELPYNLQGLYVRKWRDRHAKGSQTRIIHAKINDKGLLRYSTDDQMLVLLRGDVQELHNGDVVASNYCGFYLNEKGSVSPSGISFYKWNGAEESWDLLGMIPFQPDLGADSTGTERKVWGFTEPAFVELRNRYLICVVRSSEEEKLTPMYRSVSKDGGRSWSKPVAFTPNGVKPQLLALGNGTTVLSSGRPGVQLRFNFDGTGEDWTEAIDMLPFMKENGGITREVSCGYTSLLPIDKNSFFLVYSDFLEQNQGGEVRKAIKIRKITVKNYKTN